MIGTQRSTCCAAAVDPVATSAEPAVTVRLRDTTSTATARVVEAGDESERGRGLVFEKYQPRYSGSLERWRRESLLVAIDVPGAD